MSFTNAQLAQQIADLIEYWSSFNTEYSDWIGGAVNGGPNSDGEYPLTNWAGAETLLPCPAKLSDNVTGYVAIVDASATAAAASAAAAATSESNAATSETNADADAAAAAASAAAAAVDEGLAASSATVATAQANLATDRAGYAQEWANAAYGILVSAAAGGDQVDDYSARHWAEHAASLNPGASPQVYLRSDVADQADGVITFTAAPTITAATPAFFWRETDAPVDEGNWRMRSAAGQFAFYAGNDAESTWTKIFHVNRTGTALDEFLINAPVSVPSLASTGAVTGSNLNVSNWDTAFGWGDHSTAGYITGGPFLPLAGGAMTGDITFENGEELWFKDSLGTARRVFTLWTDDKLYVGETGGVHTTEIRGSAVTINGLDTVRRGETVADVLNNYVYVNRDSTNPALYVMKDSVTGGPAIKAGVGTMNSTTFTDYVEIGTAGYHVKMIGPAPKLYFEESDASLDNKLWDIVAASEQLRFRILNDAQTANLDWMTVDRTGVTLPIITVAGEFRAVSTATNTPALKATNSGTSNNVIAKFVGDSDSLEIRCIASGDYQIYNSQQGNAINIYDGTGGVRIQYNASTNFYFDDDGFGLTQSTDKVWWGGPTTTYITEGTDNQVRLGTDHGYWEMGPQNTSYCHYSSSPAQMYTASGHNFNGTMRRYNKGAYLYLASSSYSASGVGAVTISTASPSGGSNGDIWLKY